MSDLFITERCRQLLVRIRRTSVWTISMWALVCLHAIIVIRLQRDIYGGLGTFSFDVGLYDQGLWLLSRGDAPFVTLMGRNLFGDHASLILIFLVPLYWIIPGTQTLLALQAIVIAAGALPIFYFARRWLNSPFLGVLMGIVWLVNPAVNGTNLENYHPDSFLGLFVPIAMVCALSKKWRGYWIAVVLCLLVKEDVLLVVIPMGALLALRGDVRRGLITILTALVSTLIGMYLLMRSLVGVPTRNGWRIPFGGFGGLVTETFTRPSNVYRYLTSEGRVMYLWKMFVPFAFMSFLAPEVAMVSFLVIATNIVSNFWYQFHIEYHYSIVAVPALLLAVVVGAARLPQKRKFGVVCLVAVTSVVTGAAWSYVPFRPHTMPHWSANNPIAIAGREIVTSIPADAVVSSHYLLTTQIAHRKEIYQFPNPFRITLYGPDSSLDGQRSPLATGVEFVVLPRQRDEGTAKDWDAIAGDFKEFASNSFWQVFVRIVPSATG